MDQTAHMNRFSPPLYAGALQLDAYSSGIPTARPPSYNPAVYTPSSVLFPPQRSPKGPRPAPSSTHAQNFVEPARIPLPADDVDALQHATTNNTYYYGDVEEEFSIPTAESSRQVFCPIPETFPAIFFSFSANRALTALPFDRNVPETLANSLFYGTSASPPPFARDTRKASISSTGSSSRHRSHPSIFNTLASAATASAPDPWVEQVSIAPPDVIDLDANPISFTQDLIQSKSTQALERSTVIGHFESPTVTNTTAGVRGEEAGSDQQPLCTTPPLNSDPTTETADGKGALENHAGDRVTFSGIYHAVRKAVAERKDGDPHVQPLAIKANEAAADPEDPSNEDPIPSPNSPQELTEAIAQSSLFESLLPPPFSTASTNATSVPVLITSISRPPSNFNPKQSIIVGSHDSARMQNPLAESTTWEKIEGINDEWQELSNPHEDVLAISESEADEDSDLDDDEWEDSRKLTAMADSAFLPSVERRRRLAAAAQLKKEDQGDGAGIATPRGKRTPTTSFAQNKPVLTGVQGCSYEAYNSNHPGAHHRSARSTTPSQTSKLTPQQEQLVAELQRARTTRGVAIPLHQPMNRRVVPLSSDW